VGKGTGADIVKHQSGSDPAAVAFDAVEAAKHRGSDVVIIDTAGRLHTKSSLMDELKKVDRVISKACPGAPHEKLLVIDATTGQNAIRQAAMFNEAIGLTGIALTKLDGTAKGGVIFAIRKELNIPVKLIGVGEGIDDLRDFDPQEFVKALFEA
jgi:fused signal recognition particle receptor